MFDNLNTLIQKKMGMQGFAKVMGFTEKTARNKLQGVTEFSLEEAERICEIWPEYNFKWIFERRHSNTDQSA